MRQHVIDRVENIKRNVEKRKLALEKDEKSLAVVENRIISPHLAEVSGIDYHLRRINLAKQAESVDEVKDAWSHGCLNRGEIRQRYDKSPAGSPMRACSSSMKS
jgi:hypothetical protein